jgi:hypothetical protein
LRHLVSPVDEHWRCQKSEDMAGESVPDRPGHQIEARALRRRVDQGRIQHLEAKTELPSSGRRGLGSGVRAVEIEVNAPQQHHPRCDNGPDQSERGNETNAPVSRQRVAQMLDAAIVVVPSFECARHVDLHEPGGRVRLHLTDQIHVRRDHRA